MMECFILFVALGTGARVSTVSTGARVGTGARVSTRARVGTISPFTMNPRGGGREGGGGGGGRGHRRA